MKDCRRGYLQNLSISTATCLMIPIEGVETVNLHFSKAINFNHFYTEKNAHYRYFQPIKALHQGRHLV